MRRYRDGNLEIAIPMPLSGDVILLINWTLQLTGMKLINMFLLANTWEFDLL